MKPVSAALPDRRVWLRVASPGWENPLDATWAGIQGGRWNPPNSFPTLYFNADLRTARLQIERLCDGMPFSPEDISDNAYTLVCARLPASQRAADAVSVPGLRALGMPASYPLRNDGKLVEHAICQSIGTEIRDLGLNGVWCRSAASNDGGGRELAWFPGAQPARQLRKAPIQFGQWRHASSWRDIGLPDQSDPG